MGSRGSDFDSDNSEKKNVALNSETEKIASRLISDFKSTTTYGVVERTKTLRGMQLLGLVGPDGRESDVSKNFYKLKPYLSKIGKNDLYTGEAIDAEYKKGLKKLEFDKMFKVNINGKEEEVDFYIKAYYDAKLGKTMIDSFHPKQVGSRTGHHWNQDTNKLWK